MEFDLAGCLGRDDEDVTLVAGAENSAAETAGTVATCSEGICGSGGVVRSLSGSTMSGGTFLRGMRVRTSLRRFGWCGTGIGGTGLGGAGLNGTRLGQTGLGGTRLVGTGLSATRLAGTGLGALWLGGIWRVASREASGALGRRK